MEAEWQDIQGRMNSTENITWGIKKRHENSQEKIKLKRFKEEKSISVMVWQDPSVASVGEGHGGRWWGAEHSGVLQRKLQWLSQWRVSVSVLLPHSGCSAGCRPSVPRTTDLILGTGRPFAAPKALPSGHHRACSFWPFRSHLRSHHLHENALSPHLRWPQELPGFC